MTIAVRLPAVAGLVEKVTVSEVADAAVTVPAPSLNTTVLLPGVLLKPKPLIVTVAASAAKFVVLLVTTGMTVAISTAVPLLTPLVVTIAVRLPALVGLVDRVTLSAVDVAAVTVPTAPLFKTTVLLAAVVSKPKPLIVKVVASAASAAALVVTTGLTVATCTELALFKLLVVTTADRLPATTGGVVKVTVSVVEVDAVTSPAVSPSKSTMLLPGVALKPKPLMVIVDTLAAMGATLVVTTGMTLATWTDALAALLVVTTAVKLPAAVGGVVIFTVRVVAVAAVTVPAPLLKTTVLFAAVVLKPVP